MEPLFTVKQIEQLLGLGHTKVYELLRTGELPSIKIGTSRRITYEAAKDFIAQKVKEQSSRSGDSQ